MRVPLLLVALLPLPAVAADALIGEWSTDAANCTKTRVTYTVDGKHEALLNDNGQWRTLGSGSFSHEGDRITVRAGAIEDRLLILSLDSDRLVLRNEDEARMKAAGTDSIGFVRCPAR